MGQKKHTQEMLWAARASKKQIGLGMGWAEVRMTWREWLGDMSNI